MHISKLFNLNTTGHKNIDFIDIDEVKDTKLFLDPYVIQALDDAFCIEAQKSINSFFKELFIACKSRNDTRLRELLNTLPNPMKQI